MLGAVDATVALIRRNNKRYQDLISGKYVPKASAVSSRARGGGAS